MKIPKKLISCISEERNFLLATHINPDGDTLGSALALAEALRSRGQEVAVFNRDTVPDLYAFLPSQSIVTFRIRAFLKKDPVLVLLDCNSPERAALGELSFRRSVVIDHHETEGGFGTVRWIDRSASATGEMVFHLIRALGVSLTKKMATNLYTAISLDTGTFRYSNTSADVMRACAELIDAGAVPGRIADLLYETWTMNRFNLLRATLNTLEIKDGVAMAHITRRQFQATKTRAEDTENFSNFARMIGPVRISAIFREESAGRWKVSLRSKGDVNVVSVAERFSGGGHKNAAGCRIAGTITTAKTRLLRACREILV